MTSTAMLLGLGASDAVAPGPPQPPQPARIAAAAQPKPMPVPAATPENRGARSWAATIIVIIAAQAAGRAPGASFPK